VNVPSNFDNTVLSANGTFIAPGTFTITGSGGDPGPFSFQLNVTAPPVLSSPANAAKPTFTRANGATITWTGGASGKLIRLRGDNALDPNFNTGASFECLVDAGAGSFTVPPAILLAMPATPVTIWTFQPYVGLNLPLTGVSAGSVLLRYLTSFFPTLQ